VNPAAGGWKRQNMNKEISPEERLFNVIKTGKNSSSLFQAEKFISQPTAAIEMPLPFDVQAGLRSIDIKAVNKALTALLFLLMGVVVFMCVHKKVISLKELPEIPLNNLQPTNAVPAQTYQPVNFYLAQVKKRDLFHPVQSSVAPVEGTTASNQEFSLSGIYMGQYPQVIITDKAEQKAYFLKEGDEIKGYTVKSILKDKVILQQGDEETELL